MLCGVIAPPLRQCNCAAATLSPGLNCSPPVAHLDHRPTLWLVRDRNRLSLQKFPAPIESNRMSSSIMKLKCFRDNNLNYTPQQKSFLVRMPIQTPSSHAIARRGFGPLAALKQALASCGHLFLSVLRLLLRRKLDRFQPGASCAQCRPKLTLLRSVPRIRLVLSPCSRLLRCDRCVLLCIAAARSGKVRVRA